jgi:quinolinate synthase
LYPHENVSIRRNARWLLRLKALCLWDFNKPMGGLTEEQIRNAKIFLWGGFCSVHQMFKPEQIDNFLAKYPETKVIAHPQAPFEACQKAEYIGSTTAILRTIREAEPNTRWLVATELNLVNRLHEECKKDGKNVHFMSPTLCMCSTMFRTDPQHLAWVMDNLVEGHVVNQIVVDKDDARLAKKALDNMLAIH